MELTMRLTQSVPFNVAPFALGPIHSAVYVISVFEDTADSPSRWALGAQAVLDPATIYWLSGFSATAREADHEAHEPWLADTANDPRIAAILIAIITSGNGRMLRSS